MPPRALRTTAAVPVGSNPRFDYVGFRAHQSVHEPVPAGQNQIRPLMVLAQNGAGPITPMTAGAASAMHDGNGTCFIDCSDDLREGPSAAGPLTLGRLNEVVNGHCQECPLAVDGRCFPMVMLKLTQPLTDGVLRGLADQYERALIAAGGNPRGVSALGHSTIAYVANLQRVRHIGKIPQERREALRGDRRLMAQAVESGEVREETKATHGTHLALNGSSTLVHGGLVQMQGTPVFDEPQRSPVLK